mmetsp:Transcript_45754/g.115169  ORF Transcript_45754/g.115169 Transcript_45754/m.115169 type:complete len:176 (+) Transcript_45754:52-579(+)
MKENDELECASPPYESLPAQAPVLAHPVPDYDETNLARLYVQKGYPPPLQGKIDAEGWEGTPTSGPFAADDPDDDPAAPLLHTREMRAASRHLIASLYRRGVRMIIVGLLVTIAGIGAVSALYYLTHLPYIFLMYGVVVVGAMFIVRGSYKVAVARRYAALVPEVLEEDQPEEPS